MAHNSDPKSVQLRGRSKRLSFRRFRMSMIKTYYFETKGVKIKIILYRCNSKKLHPGVTKNFKGRDEVQLLAMIREGGYFMDKLHPEHDSRSNAFDIKLSKKVKI